MLTVVWIWALAAGLAWIAWCWVRAEPAPERGPTSAWMAAPKEAASGGGAVSRSPTELRAAWRKAIRAELRGERADARALAAAAGWPLARVRRVLRAARGLPVMLSSLAPFKGGPVALDELGTALALKRADLAVLLDVAADLKVVERAGLLVREPVQRRGMTGARLSAPALRRRARALGLDARGPLELCEVATAAAVAAEGERAAALETLALDAAALAFRRLRRAFDAIPSAPTTRRAKG